MNREKTLKIVLPILILVAAMVWGRALIGLRPAQSPTSVVQPLARRPALEHAVMPVEHAGGVPRQKKSSYEDWGRNPFMSSLAVSQGPILDGILWDASKPVAIINGEIVGKGDSVGIYVVVEVRPESVLLNDGEKDIELRLGGGQ